VLKCNIYFYIDDRSKINGKEMISKSWHHTVSFYNSLTHQITHFYKLCEIQLNSVSLI